MILVQNHQQLLNGNNKCLKIISSYYRFFSVSIQFLKALNLFKLMKTKKFHANSILYLLSDANFLNSTHILFGNYGQFGDYLNPYANMVRGYKDESYNMIMKKKRDA